MRKDEKQFYLVDLQILPEAIKKTIKVKEMLKDGTCGSINEAVHQVDISRSAYYKYKDHVAPAIDDREDYFVVLFIIMQDDMTLYSRILRRVLKDRNELLACSKTRISDKYASLFIHFRTEETELSLQDLKYSLTDMKGIQSLLMKSGGEFK
ncbi:amino acid-binding protein [Dialister sp.]|jgi:chorismate mutase|uniref:amino acid-binding protein n=1 Tax=Dialister sp. TaxID=1955814 RepID=UPI002E8204BD|nr:amino acid-binding protein [Dialister sp.]MEE3452082.1 amino acid-binding protein [Dialister sp.]